MAEEQRNQTVVNPNPMGATPAERGCMVHTHPTRKQRRLAAREARRRYSGGKLSGKAQHNRYLRRAYEIRCEKRAGTYAAGELTVRERSGKLAARLKTGDEKSLRHKIREGVRNLLRKAEEKKGG